MQEQKVTFFIRDYHFPEDSVQEQLSNMSLINISKIKTATEVRVGELQSYSDVFCVPLLCFRL